MTKGEQDQRDKTDKQTYKGNDKTRKQVNKKTNRKKRKEK